MDYKATSDLYLSADDDSNDAPSFDQQHQQHENNNDNKSGDYLFGNTFKEAQEKNTENISTDYTSHDNSFLVSGSSSNKVNDVNEENGNEEDDKMHVENQINSDKALHNNENSNHDSKSKFDYNSITKTENEPFLNFNSIYNNNKDNINFSNNESNDDTKHISFIKDEGYPSFQANIKEDPHVTESAISPNRVHITIESPFSDKPLLKSEINATKEEVNATKDDIYNDDTENDDDNNNNDFSEDQKCNNDNNDNAGVDLFQNENNAMQGLYNFTNKLESESYDNSESSNNNNNNSNNNNNQNKSDLDDDDMGDEEEDDDNNDPDYINPDDDNEDGEDTDVEKHDNDDDGDANEDGGGAMKRMADFLQSSDKNCSNDNAGGDGDGENNLEGDNNNDASDQTKQQIKKKRKKTKNRKRSADSLDNTDGGGAKKPRMKKKKRRRGETSAEKRAKLDRKNLFERKNIRKIFEDENLDEETKAAQKEEMERKQRLLEIQEKLRQQAMELRAQREKEMTTQKELAASLGSGDSSVSGSMLKKDIGSASLKSLLEDKSDSSSNIPNLLGPGKSLLINKQPKPPDVVEISSSSDDENEEDDDDLIVMSEEEEEDDGTDDAENSGSHVNDAMNRPDSNGCVLVNVGHPPDEPDIFLAPQLASAVKPHQIGGIRFMYDNVVESIGRYKTSNGFGCILAHSMGLGKTIQVISFVDIFLRHTGAKSVLVIVPVNTLQNWINEFNMWLPVVEEDGNYMGGIDREILWPREFKLYVINDNLKTTNSRTKIVADWHETGGVLLLGYEMYRLLIKTRGVPAKSRKAAKKTSAEPVVIDVDEEEVNKEIVKNLHEALMRPGPDLVVCDEGHRIKNSHASISQVLKNIRTRRRIVLTGYPLQNNLLEYWCMVDFVRPNYLGTKQEFCNMFERPIMNGQCADSTPKDVKLMRFRAHVLHSLLEGFVQRRGHAVLQAALPQKEEYVIFVRLSPIQRKLYNEFMSAIKDSGSLTSWTNSNNPIKAFSVCCKIWNHPDILFQVLEQRKDDNDLDLDEAKVNNADIMAPPTPTTNKRTSKRSSSRLTSSASCSSIASNYSCHSNASSSSSYSNSNNSYNNNNYNNNFNSFNDMGYGNNGGMGMGGMHMYDNMNSHHHYNSNNNMMMGSHSNNHNIINNNLCMANMSINNNFNSIYNNYNNYINNNNNNNNNNFNNNNMNGNMNSNMNNSMNNGINNINQQDNSVNAANISNMNNISNNPFANQSDNVTSSNAITTTANSFVNTSANTPVTTATTTSAAAAATSNTTNTTTTSTTSTSSEAATDADKKAENASEVVKEGQSTSSTNEKKESQVISYDWAMETMKDYVAGILEHSGKMVFLLDIINESVLLGDKILVFSQSLYTLTLIEDYLSRRRVPGYDEYWQKNRNYFRLDGGTAGVDREKLINQFNDYNNTRIHLFLLSTRAGCLGINLIGACRVVIFDASWNPCHDCQAVCRVYRYGQNKCCFVYRLVSDNTMEKNIYDRQINKQGISDRVVDELNPQNLLSKKQVDMLMRCEETESPEVNLEGCEEKCSDPLLIQVIKRNKHWLTKEPFTHESLLLDRKDQKLTRHEKRLAKQGYEMEKKMSSLGIRQSSLYGKSLDGVSMVRFGQRPVASVRPMMSTNIRGGLAPRGVTNNQFRAPGLKPGVSVQQIQTTTDIIIPGTNTVSDSAGSKIPAGEKVLVIKTPKGVYIRTSHGKIFAVRTAPKPGATTAAASTATASAATNSSALSGTTTTQARAGTISSAKKVDDDDKVMEVVDDDDDEDGVSIVKEDTSKSNANNVSNNNTASPLSQQAAAGDSSKVAATATATTTVSASASSVASSASSATAQSNISANIVLTTTNNPTIRIAEDSYSIGNHSKYNSAATASTATALASSTTTGNKNILPVASTSAQHPSLASPTTTPMPKQQQPQDATGGDKQQTNCNNNINSSNNNNNSFMNNSNKFSSKSTNPLPVRPVLPMPNNNNNNNNNSNNNFSNNNNNNANKNTKKTKDKGDFSSPSSSSSHHATKETGSVTPFNNNPSTTKPVAQPQPVANNSASSQQQQQHNSFMDWNKRPPGSSSSSASSASMMNKDFDSLFGIPPPSPGHLASSFDGGMGGLFPNYLKPSADPMSGFPSSFSSNHSSSLADRHSSKSNFTANPFSSSSSSSSLHHPVPMTPSYLHPGMNPYAMPNPYSWMTSPMWMDAQHQLPHFPGSDYGSNPAADAFGLAGSISGSGGSSLGSDLLGMDNFPGSGPSGGSSGVGGPSASVGSGLAGFGGPFEDRSFSSLLMGEDENASRNRSNNNNSSNSSSSGSNRNNSSSNNNMNSPGYRQSSYPHPSPMTGYPYHNPYSPYPPMPQPGSYYPGPGSSSHSATPGMGRGSYLGPTSMHYPPQHPGPFMQSPYDFGRNILQGSSKKEGFDEK